jgi:transcriptional regulator with XRE-family HTH domain
MITPELHLGQRIKLLMMERSLNQEELARKSGVSASRISQLINHPPDNITYKTICGLASAMKMSTDHFIYCIESENGRYVPYHLTPNGMAYPKEKGDKRRLTSNHW